MAMTAWSTTAANNVLANTGINMDEGMPPSAVNDSIRDIMAVLKTAIDTGNMTATGATFNLINTTATTVNFAGAATTLSMGAGAASTLNANFTTAINLNTAAIVSNQTTVAVINTNATTVNAFGAASVALNIGHASAAAAFPGGISIPTGKSVTGAGTAAISGFASASIGALTATSGHFSSNLRVIGNDTGTHYASNSLLLYNSGSNAALVSMGSDASTRGAFTFYNTSSDFSSYAVGLTISAAGNVGIGPSNGGSITAGAGSTFGGTGSSSAYLLLGAGTTAIASLRIPAGAAPTSPVAGDIWTDGTHIYWRDTGGTSRQLDNP